MSIYIHPTQKRVPLVYQVSIANQYAILAMADPAAQTTDVIRSVFGKQGFLSEIYGAVTGCMI
jgi:hypothetical protein